MDSDDLRAKYQAHLQNAGREIYILLEVEPRANFNHDQKNLIQFFLFQAALSYNMCCKNTFEVFFY